MVYAAIWFGAVLVESMLIAAAVFRDDIGDFIHDWNLPEFFEVTILAFMVIVWVVALIAVPILGATLTVGVSPEVP